MTGLPFHHDDGGVVPQPAVLVLQYRVVEPAHRLRCGRTRAGVPDDEIAEPLQAERGAVHAMAFGHAIGLEQHAVTGLEFLRVHLGGGFAAVRTVVLVVIDGG